MAFIAVNFYMRPSQLVAGQVVVELVLVEVQQIEIAPVVVVVAGGTFFAAHLPRCVVAHALVNLAFYLFVAGEAFVVRHFLAQHVALGTIGKAFQMGVRFGQIPGGDLGACFADKKQAEKDRVKNKLFQDDCAIMWDKSGGNLKLPPDLVLRWGIGELVN